LSAPIAPAREGSHVFAKPLNCKESALKLIGYGLGLSNVGYTGSTDMGW